MYNNDIPSSGGCLFLSMLLISSNTTSSLLKRPPCITYIQNPIATEEFT